jgi:hypothetical protein
MRPVEGRRCEPAAKIPYRGIDLSARAGMGRNQDGNGRTDRVTAITRQRCIRMIAFPWQFPGVFERSDPGLRF